MSMVLKTNMDATRTLNLMGKNQALAHNHLMKVSSGMKVRDAQDDAAAYAISEKMRVRIRALEQAHSNTQNGSNMMKTAEGAVSKILDALRTLKEKAINAANDSNSDEDRRMIQQEFNQLVDQIDEDALITFNNKYLIDGTRNVSFSPMNLSHYNIIGRDVSAVYFNNTLANDTDLNTALTSLKNRNGDSLEIQSGDKYTVSWVMDGKHFTESDTVGNKTIGEIMERFDDDLAYSVFAGQTSYANGMDISGTFVPLNPGFLDFDSRGNRDAFGVASTKYGQQLNAPAAERLEQGLAVTKYNIGGTFGGFTISIMDSEGNVKKSANAALEFKLLQREETITGDNALSFQVGADANFATKFALTDMRTKALGLRGSQGNIVSVSTKEDANATINVLDNVLTKVLDQQSDIGAAIARLERTATNLRTEYTDDQASESVIRDADMATEMAGYLKYNVLTNASQAMLAQANQNPMDVLSLIGNLGE